MPYSQFEPDELILRDHLAMDRTTLANERTLLSYLRLAILLLISAVSLIKVYPASPEMRRLGFVLIGLGIGAGLLGFWRFQRMRRRIGRVHATGRPAQAGEQE